MFSIIVDIGSSVFTGARIRKLRVENPLRLQEKRAACARMEKWETHGRPLNLLPLLSQRNHGTVSTRKVNRVGINVWRMRTSAELQKLQAKGKVFSGCAVGSAFHRCSQRWQTFDVNLFRPGQIQDFSLYFDFYENKLRRQKLESRSISCDIKLKENVFDLDPLDSYLK